MSDDKKAADKPAAEDSDLLEESSDVGETGADLAASEEWVPWSPPAVEPWPYDDPAMATLPPVEAKPDAPAPAPAPASSMSVDPASAAFEAARIAEQIVGKSFESSAGAAIVAAAAAGAAIEAVRARRAAGEPEPEPSQMPLASGTNDPVITARFQRDKILRALAEDVAAQAEAGKSPEAPPPRPSQQMRIAMPPPLPRARSEREPAPEPTDEDSDLDAVEIASAAIQRLRRRARTDLAELRVQYQRHDILVLLLAFVLIVVAGRLHAVLVQPDNRHYSERGLEFDHPAGFLSAGPIPIDSPRILRDPTGSPPGPSSALNVGLTWAHGGSARIEVLVDKKPAWSNIVTGLELDRRTRWGELYKLRASSVESIAGHDWLRTAYRYSHAAKKGNEPTVDDALEYATIDREQIYVITLFGTRDEIDRLATVIAPTLRVPTATGLPLVPQTRALDDRTYPNPVSAAFDSTVMVVVADLVDGRLRARGGGSGVIVGADGSILTNYHVIHDKDGRLHDVFVIGRFAARDAAPQLVCAGRPSRSKLDRDLDLALIKCDMDLDGRTYVPSADDDMQWPTLAEGRAEDVKIGSRVWVLGYPDVGGGGLMLNQGEVEGFTGRDGASGKEFIKTDASITHGNSGGPVVDDNGKLIGIASAYRIKVSSNGTGVIETAQVGLVRALSTASQALAIAAAGWTPLEGHNELEIQPSAVEAPSEGVRIGSRVIDAASDAPIADALVMVLKPGVSSSAVDVNRIDDQVLSWGRSNTNGDVVLKQPVPIPGIYTVMVTANGYEALIGENALNLKADTPHAYDPWGFIRLRSR